MKTVEYWQVTESDYNGGHRKHIGNFSTEAVALEVKGNDRWCHVDCSTITVFDSVEEFQAHDIETLRKKALAKLTAEEKRALGL